MRSGKVFGSDLYRARRGDTVQATGPSSEMATGSPSSWNSCRSAHVKLDVGIDVATKFPAELGSMGCREVAGEGPADGGKRAMGPPCARAGLAGFRDRPGHEADAKSSLGGGGHVVCNRVVGVAQADVEERHRVGIDGHGDARPRDGCDSLRVPIDVEQGARLDDAATMSISLECDATTRFRGACRRDEPSILRRHG